MPRQPDTAVRAQLEAHLLSLMRGTQALTASGKMSDSAPAWAPVRAHPQVATFWNLAAGMFEAQHHGLLPFDVFTKRVASRLLAQFRILQRGDSDVSERLARDLLFFCAQSAVPGRGVRLPRLAAARGGLRSRRPGSHRLLGERPGSVRPGAHRPCQEARRRRQGSLVGDRRRRDASSRGPGRAVRAGRRFAAQAFPVRRNVRGRAADGGRPDPAGRGAAARGVGDGGGDQPSLHRGGARGRRLRQPRPRRARAPARRAPRLGARSGHRPIRSSPGWRSSTGASPIGRRWAASSRSCGPR